jgi:hypothetical protein
MASRLCKAAMLSRFNLLAKEAKKDDLLEASTYHAAKVRYIFLFFLVVLEFELRALHLSHTSPWGAH